MGPCPSTGLLDRMASQAPQPAPHSIGRDQAFHPPIEHHSITEFHHQRSAFLRIQHLSPAPASRQTHSHSPPTTRTHHTHRQTAAEIRNTPKARAGVKQASPLPCSPLVDPTTATPAHILTQPRRRQPAPPTSHLAARRPPLCPSRPAVHPPPRAAVATAHPAPTAAAACAARRAHAPPPPHVPPQSQPQWHTGAAAAPAAATRAAQAPSGRKHRSATLRRRDGRHHRGRDGAAVLPRAGGRGSCDSGHIPARDTWRAALTAVLN